MKSNTFVYLIAGHETTAHTLTYLYGLLALYPDEQEKLYEKLVRIAANYCHSDDPWISAYAYETGW